MSYLLQCLYYYFDVYESFLYLSNLVCTNRFMLDLYSFNMRKVYSYAQVLDYHLGKEAPELLKYFELNGINTMTFSVDWFYTLFSRAFDISIVRVIWDMFLLLGPEFIVRVGVAMMIVLKDELMTDYLNEGFKFVRVRTGKIKISRILELTLKKDYSPKDFEAKIEELYKKQMFIQNHPNGSITN